MDEITECFRIALVILCVVGVFFCVQTDILALDNRHSAKPDSNGHWQVLGNFACSELLKYTNPTRVAMFSIHLLIDLSSIAQTGHHVTHHIRSLRYIVRWTKMSSFRKLSWQDRILSVYPNESTEIQRKHYTSGVSAENHVQTNKTQKPYIAFSAKMPKSNSTNCD